MVSHEERGRGRWSHALAVAALGLALAVALAAPARAGDEDFYFSVPTLGAIYRWDAVTHQMEELVTGLGIPFYGAWASDGFLYMPDRALGAVFKISQAGAITPFAAGGFLQTPITVVQAPDGSLICSDLFSQTIVRLGPGGQQTLLADNVSSGGVIAGPGGLAMGLDGTLYISNNLGNSVAAMDLATGNTWLVSDGAGLLDMPGGIAVDGSGNLFVGSYGMHTVVRIRIDTGLAEVFCADPFIHYPNDLRLAHEGGLHLTMKTGALVHIDALGQLALVVQGSAGEIDGFARPSDSPPCSGRYIAYGAGTAGSGGIVPELRGIFSPCPASAVALEAKGLLGGATGALAWGLSSANLPLKGGHLLVNLGPPGGLIPLVFPGAGPGGGGLVIPFSFPDDAALSGFSFYLQLLAKDPGAPGGVSFSNGLQELIGS